MKKNVLFFPIVTLIFLLGCKKKVTEVNKDFIGTWYQESKFKDAHDFNTKSLQIKSNSDAEFNDRSKAIYSNYTGKARIKNNTLHIGVKKFKIDIAPKKLGNVGDFWMMRLGGENYYTDKLKEDGIGMHCSNTSLSIRNVGTDTIQATMDGVNYLLYPYQILQSNINCFGCETKYSDNKGNNFSFFNIECVNVVDVQ